MRILVTGGTGFIGSKLCSRLVSNGHQVFVLSRNAEAISSPMIGISNLNTIDDNQSFDALINLAGEPIADKRWSAKQQRAILDSRLQTTQQLINYIKRAEYKPGVLVSGSAIGYYGLGTGEDEIDESHQGDDSFSSKLCQQWEAAALQSEAEGVRTCLLRIGIVIGGEGGALRKMLAPFKLGLGGRIGNGQQWMPWIHLHDMVAIILVCLQNPQISGALNCVAPNPVRNLEFTKILGAQLNRPTFIPMPVAVVQLLMGQMGEELLLSGKRVVPAKLSQLGFNFKYETLDQALATSL